ncbi:transcription repressor OFP17-like [Amaranthus tricolor]|uniref:transcription repressor OFP17-like n=1 Tax=Amaranthus tricolor TaxID=29722 RepID=UPI00259112EE|nr:transcription repressor OFP17-like [Amaranthus tricolor]
MKLKTLFHFKAKVIEPCSKLLSMFKHNFEKPSFSSRTPTFRMPKRRTKPKLRTKVVRFRKPFSIKAFRFPRCRPKNKFRLRKSRPSLSKFKKRFRRKKHAQSAKKPIKKVRIAELLTVLFSLRKTKDTDSEGTDQTMGDPRSVSPSEGGHAKEPFPSPITPGYVRISDDSKKESSDDLEEDEDMCKSFENHLVEMIVEEGKVKDLMDVEELLYCWGNLKSPVFIDLVCRFYGELCKDMLSSSQENESTQETSTSTEL